MSEFRENPMRGYVCTEPGGCASCPDREYCRRLRVDYRVTTEAAERAVSPASRDDAEAQP